MTPEEVRRAADKLGHRQAQILRALHRREGCDPPRNFCVLDLPNLMPPGQREVLALSLRKACHRLRDRGLLEPFRGDRGWLRLTGEGRAVAYRLSDLERQAAERGSR